jgi:thymidylate synthase
MAAEPMWVIEGSNRLDWSPEIDKIQSPYSDNQLTLAGAYGPPYKQQLEYIVRTLNSDLNSRQAVMTIWKRDPFPSKDIPCTVALQFIVREGHINCIVTMRSSDVGMGLPYDMLTFACMAAEVAANLNEPVELGSCYITAGSRHIYHDQFDKLNYVFKNTKLDMEYKPWAIWAWPAIKDKMMGIAKQSQPLSVERSILQADAKAIMLGLMK